MSCITPVTLATDLKTLAIADDAAPSAVTESKVESAAFGESKVESTAFGESKVVQPVVSDSTADKKKEEMESTDDNKTVVSESADEDEEDEDLDFDGEDEAEDEDEEFRVPDDWMLATRLEKESAAFVRNVRDVVSLLHRNWQHIAAAIADFVPTGTTFEGAPWGESFDYSNRRIKLVDTLHNNLEVLCDTLCGEGTMTVELAAGVLLRAMATWNTMQDSDFGLPSEFHTLQHIVAKAEPSRAATLRLSMRSVVDTTYRNLRSIVEWARNLRSTLKNKSTAPATGKTRTVGFAVKN